MKKAYIISDCHGNIEGLMEALQKKKLVDSSGNRLVGKDNLIFSIGDLANCVKDSFSGDMDCLNLVGNVIDGMILGNHELPYLDSTNSFGGFWEKPEVSKRINLLLDSRLIQPAYLIAGKTLVSHAGISAHFTLGKGISVQKVYKRIEEHWNARNWNFSWFSSVGKARGGRNEAGGIFWCDFDNEFIPTDFPQIVGHTPRGVRMKGNALCIDVGAKSGKKPFILEVV